MPGNEGGERGKECHLIKFREGLLDKVTFEQKPKGNELDRNLGKEYFRERAE